MKNKRSAALAAALAVLVCCLACFFNIPAYAGEAVHSSVRPSEAGQLSVRETNLTDSEGNTVVLKGVSLHGLTWFPDFVDEDLFRQVSDDWDANLVRLPVYSTQYPQYENDCLRLTREGIDAAIAADMYVIVDWHVLEDKDPNVNYDWAHGFFSTIASEYAGVPNVIYEICNEPNGETTWSDVRKYSYNIIPLIRKYSPEAVILVGTPNYCRELSAAARNPLKIDNIMYSLHFYAATHKEDLRREYESAIRQGLPVFVSECGLSEASGDGEADYVSAGIWFSLLEKNNTGYVVWNLSNKDETSSLLSPFYNVPEPLDDRALSGTGIWVRELLRGTEPDEIEVRFETGKRSVIPEWVLNPLETENLDIARIWPHMALSGLIFIMISVITIKLLGLYSTKHHPVYDDLFSKEEKRPSESRWGILLSRLVILLSVFFTILYLGWRILFSIPFKSGILAVSGNIILLIVEIFGFLESMVLYSNLMGMRDHPLPEIRDEDYPDVDIFIATYNEPPELLWKTINGCIHLKYPDKSRVHVWLCDDNRRTEMRELAEEMHIGYFDRPDNKGAKAGNLNHALSLTKAPYVVTLDADMIPRSDLLMKTIPYFVDANKRSEDKKDGKKIRLGLLQTPQCFYTPDVFQYALYSEKTAPNEQDFFYRTIEVAKTSSNSVIYGGSNTIIAREALEAVGGFYTESITEDFATGLLIESHGFVSLALPEPLASGMTPHTYKEHIQQRRRWGRGVISTARQLHILTGPGLSMTQRLSYLSSVVYWYSPVKNLIYLVSPLLFATFAIPVFRCGWLDLVLYWFPMFVMQDICLRIFSHNAVSLKWSGIYETSVMPHLLIPVIKESLGIKEKKFEVTDKSGKKRAWKRERRAMIPFLILIALSAAGIIRSFYVLGQIKALGIVVLLFWLIRNLYLLIMSLFLIDGRDSEDDSVEVIDAENVVLRYTDEEEDSLFEGITTYLNEHRIRVYLDSECGLNIGDAVEISLMWEDRTVKRKGIITGRTLSRLSDFAVYSLELIDHPEDEGEYLQILYDRIPTLPQTLTRDFGIIAHMLRNLAFRILR